MKPRLLIVKTGSTMPEVAREHGDFEAWFARALGAPERFAVARVVDGEPLPDLRAFDGVIVTGSPLSMCAPPEPWTERVGGELREAVERGQALLGVCFGHQMLAHAFGTPVVVNPRGREIGTIRVDLTAEGLADPLFEGLGSQLVVQATHSDAVSQVPDGAVLLASNELCPVQALRIGPRARTVQFHPEMTDALMRDYVRLRAGAMRAEGLDPEAYEQAVAPTPVGQVLLERFETRLVGG